MAADQDSLSHRPAPQALDLEASTAGLRAVALLEAVKGSAVLLLGLGLLALLHKDVEQFAEDLLVHLHISTEHRIGHVVLNAASKMTDARLWGIAAGAAMYAVVRFVEAYGLWHRRVWAEWFAMLSGALYLPWELVKLVEHPSWLHWALILINLTIVLYMLKIRIGAISSARV